jgi:hypothetical protein
VQKDSKSFHLSRSSLRRSHVRTDTNVGTAGDVSADGRETGRDGAGSRSSAETGTAHRREGGDGGDGAGDGETELSPAETPGRGESSMLRRRGGVAASNTAKAREETRKARHEATQKATRRGAARRDEASKVAGRGGDAWRKRKEEVSKSEAGRICIGLSSVYASRYHVGPGRIFLGFKLCATVRVYT